MLPPRPITRVLLLVLLISTLQAKVSAADTWLTIASPHFTIVSNDTEHTARTIVWQFEQVRAVAESLWPWARIETDKPVLILAVEDEESMKMPCGVTCAPATRTASIPTTTPTGPISRSCSDRASTHDCRSGSRTALPECSPTPSSTATK